MFARLPEPCLFYKCNGTTNLRSLLAKGHPLLGFHFCDHFWGSMFSTVMGTLGDSQSLQAHDLRLLFPRTYYHLVDAESMSLEIKLANNHVTIPLRKLRNHFWLDPSFFTHYASSYAPCFVVEKLPHRDRAWHHGDLMPPSPPRHLNLCFARSRCLRCRGAKSHHAKAPLRCQLLSALGCPSNFAKVWFPSNFDKV